MATTTIDSAALGIYGTYNEGVGPYYASFDIWDPPSGAYDEQITYNSSTFPNGTTLAWNFPASGGGGAVLAYPEIVYGPNQYDPISPTHDIQPLQINQINNLSVTYNVSINASDSSGYDGLIETWITTQGTTNGGQDVLANHFADEVEFLTHSPSWVSNYVESLNPQRLTVDGMNLLVAKVNQSTPDVFIMPVASDWTTPVDLSSGTQTVPLGDILKAVAAAGVISGSAYVDNYQFGFEINHGSGSATVNQLSYDWNTPSLTITSPTVSSVVVSGSGITNGSGDLNAGHNVTLTVNMSEAVTVAGGIPTLTLNDGGTAGYTGGSGSNALTFSYTVAAGQNTPSLTVTAVNLNAGDNSRRGRKCRRSHWRGGHRAWSTYDRYGGTCCASD